MVRPEARILPPPSGDGVGLADWLEAIILIERRRSVSRASLRQMLANTLFFDDAFGDQLDIAIEMMLREVRRRRVLAPKIYPFRELPVGVEFDSRIDSTAYQFMLLVSISQPLRMEKRQQEVENVFDSLVLQALVQYLGAGSRGVRFGWPPHGKRPTKFRVAIKWLADGLGLSVGKGKTRPRSKDGGLDVLVWRPFPDARSGFMSILAQCTIQVDWFPKAKDIVAGVWCGWVDFGREPLTALAIPFVIPPNFEKWDELRRTVSIILDRMRLCDLLSDIELTDEVALQGWVASELEKMRDGVSASSWKESSRKRSQ